MKFSSGFRWTLGLLVGAVVLACLDLGFLVEVPLTVAFGWPFYVARVLPQVEVNPAAVMTGVICLVGFAAGSHGFLAWLYGEVRGPGAGSWRPRWTARIVVGTLLMFTSGIAAAGLAHQIGWLLASPLPLVWGSRNAVMRMQSLNNLQQIGLAYHYYSGQFGEIFPPGATTDDRGEMLHSWQTLILPYLDEPAEVRFSRPWDHPSNSTAMSRTVLQFLTPTEPMQRDSAGRGLSHYEGNVRALGGFTGLSLTDVTDGASTTILAGESAGGYLPWGRPGHWRDPADGINAAPDRGVGGRSPGGASVLMLDGSVKFLKNTIDPRVLKALATPAGGETIDPDSF